MIYFIDGYNLLFKLFHSEKKFETQRNVIIDFFHKKARLLNLNLHLVFDGYRQNKHLPSISSFDTLKVIYTSKQQTADDYILEQIYLSKNPHEITVVTADNNLKLKAKEMHSQIKSVDSFLSWLSKKEESVKKSKDLESGDYVDTKKNIERLVKIFEDKLENQSDE